MRTTIVLHGLFCSFARIGISSLSACPPSVMISTCSSTDFKLYCAMPRSFTRPQQLQERGADMA